eukprot:15842_1
MPWQIYFTVSHHHTIGIPPTIPLSHRHTTAIPSSCHHHPTMKFTIPSSCHTTAIPIMSSLRTSYAYSNILAHSTSHQLIPKTTNEVSHTMVLVLYEFLATPGMVGIFTSSSVYEVLSFYIADKGKFWNVKYPCIINEFEALRKYQS